MKTLIQSDVSVGNRFDKRRFNLIRFYSSNISKEKNMELRLKEVIGKYLDETKLTYRKLAEKLDGGNASTLFSWAQGQPVCLTKKNISTLNSLKKEIGCSWEYLLFQIECNKEDQKLVQALQDFVNKVCLSNKK